MIRAAVLHTCGQAPVVESRPLPVPAPGELTVTVTAVPITPLDLLCASGTSYFGTPATPYVPGVQGVGTLPDGTPVWFATAAGMRPGDGSMASVVTVPPAAVVPLPGDAPPALVAALGLSAVAAHQALHRTGELVAGEQVIVLGAGGVVGQAAVQLARLGGARRVIAVTRSSSPGADAVVPLRPDDDVDTLAARLREVLDGPADLVVDPVFGVPAAAALRVLRPGGRLVNLGSSAAATAPIDSATLRGGSLRILGYTNNALSTAERAAALTEIAGHAAAGRLTVRHVTVPFAETAEAWQRQASGTTDRIVLALTS
ncbi:quinone oxidoreductase family protein [Actinoplanes couchii]|uniref:NADPH:quinone reductase n=1 Tax=Actinoplanes couchii TaxID=403638 RepID=A0ABQ3X3S4_9ACTN|nr:zinc-binding alcohol dehydrogenase family protein [Actinoplanes couchii]MDR6322921.1 NADPH:quinone reductase-like Zn-dependent oxidoreductase [Actinoplanes couchii]GID53161.1 NADPH:quinone reductase [Actinoplanes couchii]